MQRTPLTPERFRDESYANYRLRRAQNRVSANTVRESRTDRLGVTVYQYSHATPAKNGGHRGAGMANIRAARKARNVRRTRAANR